MQIDEYLGVDYSNTNDWDNIFSKHNNLDYGLFTVPIWFIESLSNQKAHVIIKFIDIFRNINKFDFGSIYSGSTLVYEIILALTLMDKNKIDVYKIMNHLFKLDMDTSKILIVGGQIYGIKYYTSIKFYNRKNYKIVEYMVDNYTVIKNTRNLINNHDILLFNINNDLWLIKLFLIICKCKQKKLPKYIMIHKILYHYLLFINYWQNKD